VLKGIRINTLGYR